MNLDLTVNTDFAQVESDQQQVNLTRFPLFFPEKREFFLENAGLFQIGETTLPYEPPGTLLFFSRNIGLSEDGDEIGIIGGARLTGKLNGTELGVFHIATAETALEDETIPQTSFSAVRVKQNIFARSSVGPTELADRSAAIGSWKRTIELDPQHFDALYNLSMALFELAPREALPYLERFVREAPRERYQADVQTAEALVREIRRAARQ